ncbi:hypothetical protein [Amycolatopsis sp. NPDC051903]|uniref:hypothetical protein n=1 Tax=Amycolatopsis sp. NPDC051903 TaxID=3363936 RepID=UPI0037B3A757
MASPPPDPRRLGGTSGDLGVPKHFAYADAGIEQYWIVDLDAPVSMITYRLVDGDYENFGEHSGNVELEVAGTSVVLDLDALAGDGVQKL